MLHPSQWKPDQTVSLCGNCGLRFSLLRRRHHCRRCGDIFCDACASLTVWLRPFLAQLPPAPSDGQALLQGGGAVVLSASSSLSSSVSASAALARAAAGTDVGDVGKERMSEAFCGKSSATDVKRRTVSPKPSSGSGLSSSSPEEGLAQRGRGLSDNVGLNRRGIGNTALATQLAPTNVSYHSSTGAAPSAPTVVTFRVDARGDSMSALGSRQVSTTAASSSLFVVSPSTITGDGTSQTWKPPTVVSGQGQESQRDDTSSAQLSLLSPATQLPRLGEGGEGSRRQVQDDTVTVSSPFSRATSDAAYRAVSYNSEKDANAVTWYLCRVCDACHNALLDCILTAHEGGRAPTCSQNEEESTGRLVRTPAIAVSVPPPAVSTAASATPSEGQLWAYVRLRSVASSKGTGSSPSSPGRQNASRVHSSSSHISCNTIDATVSVSGLVNSNASPLMSVPSTPSVWTRLRASVSSPSTPLGRRLRTMASSNLNTMPNTAKTAGRASSLSAAPALLQPQELARTRIRGEAESHCRSYTNARMMGSSPGVSSPAVPGVPARLYGSPTVFTPSSFTVADQKCKGSESVRAASSATASLNQVRREGSMQSTSSQPFLRTPQLSSELGGSSAATVAATSSLSPPSRRFVPRPTTPPRRRLIAIEDSVNVVRQAIAVARRRRRIAIVLIDERDVMEATVPDREEVGCSAHSEGGRSRSQDSICTRSAAVRHRTSSSVKDPLSKLLMNVEGQKSLCNATADPLSLSDSSPLQADSIHVDELDDATHRDKAKADKGAAHTNLSNGNPRLSAATALGQKQRSSERTMGSLDDGDDETGGFSNSGPGPCTVRVRPSCIRPQLSLIVDFSSDDDERIDGAAKKQAHRSESQCQVTPQQQRTHTTEGAVKGPVAPSCVNWLAPFLPNHAASPSYTTPASKLLKASSMTIASTGYLENSCAGGWQENSTSDGENGVATPGRRASTRFPGALAPNGGCSPTLSRPISCSTAGPGLTPVCATPKAATGFCGSASSPKSRNYMRQELPAVPMTPGCGHTVLVALLADAGAVSNVFSSSSTGSRTGIVTSGTITSAVAQQNTNSSVSGFALENGLGMGAAGGGVGRSPTMWGFQQEPYAAQRQALVREILFRQQQQQQPVESRSFLFSPTTDVALFDAAHRGSASTNGGSAGEGLHLSGSMTPATQTRLPPSQERVLAAVEVCFQLRSASAEIKAKGSSTTTATPASHATMPLRLVPVSTVVELVGVVLDVSTAEAAAATSTSAAASADMDGGVSRGFSLSPSIALPSPHAASYSASATAIGFAMATYPRGGDGAVYGSGTRGLSFSEFLPQLTRLSTNVDGYVLVILRCGNRSKACGDTQHHRQQRQGSPAGSSPSVGTVEHSPCYGAVSRETDVFNPFLPCGAVSPCMVSVSDAHRSPGSDGQSCEWQHRHRVQEGFGGAQLQTLHQQLRSCGLTQPALSVVEVYDDSPAVTVAAEGGAAKEHVCNCSSAARHRCSPVSRKAESAASPLEDDRGTLRDRVVSFSSTTDPKHTQRPCAEGAHTMSLELPSNASFSSSSLLSVNPLHGQCSGMQQQRQQYQLPSASVHAHTTTLHTVHTATALKMPSFAALPDKELAVADGAPSASASITDTLVAIRRMEAQRQCMQQNASASLRAVARQLHIPLSQKTYATSAVEPRAAPTISATQSHPSVLHGAVRQSSCGAEKERQQGVPEAAGLYPARDPPLLTRGLQALVATMVYSDLSNQQS